MSSYATPKTCPWCLETGQEDPDPASLCIDHAAEYDGLSVSEMERRDREQYAEFADATYG